MKITAAGYNCSMFLDEADIPEPDEVRVFEGNQLTVEMEVTAFAARFNWCTFDVKEQNGDED